MPERLLSLVRKELIRPTTATFGDDEAFRFRHLLIRDAAYNSLPKRIRADLHELFAVWVDGHGQLLEQDEIVGYHLEQAARYRTELGEPDERVATLAAERLAAAMRTAMRRGDYLAAYKLGSRGWRLTAPGSTTRADFVPHFSGALEITGDWDTAQEMIDELGGRDDARSRGYASLFADQLARWGGRVPLTLDADAIRSAFSAAGDELGLALLARHLGMLDWRALRVGAAAALYAEGADHAARAGETALAGGLRAGYARSVLNGPLPVREVLRAFAQEGIAQPGQHARLHAMLGDFDRARQLAQAARQDLAERGAVRAAAASSQLDYMIAVHAGTEGDAIEAVAAGVAELERLNDRGYLATTAINLAMLLERAGRIEEAEHWAARARTETSPGDVGDAGGLAALGALLAAHRGDETTALAEAKRATEIAEATEFFQLRATVRVATVRTLALLRRRDEARTAAHEAIAFMEAKGDLAWAERTRELLLEL